MLDENALTETAVNIVFESLVVASFVVLLFYRHHSHPIHLYHFHPYFEDVLWMNIPHYYLQSRA